MGRGGGQLCQPSPNTSLLPQQHPGAVCFRASVRHLTCDAIINLTAVLSMSRRMTNACVLIFGAKANLSTRFAIAPSRSTSIPLSEAK